MTKTNLSPEATAALERVRALRITTQKMGYVTTREQIDIVMALDATDMLAVVDVLVSEGRAR